MKLIPFVVALLLPVFLRGQDYSSFTNTIREFYRADRRDVNALWTDLVERDHVPLVVEDSVAFFYKGNATSVLWMGDFNRWGLKRDFNNVGKKIPGTDIWILKTSFPKDARLDYKLLLDDANWILDPANQDHQWSGVGGGSPNSELRMPLWKEDLISLQPVEGLKKGKVESDLLFNSEKLGYQVTYTTYIPQGYDPGKKYPIIYVTDGYEYMHEKMGNMILVLDNLIHLKKIDPVIAVFLDHREPVNRANNRRMSELAMNETYLSFMKNEMLPLIEHAYSVSTDPGKRAILGTSMGGLAAAYFAFAEPNLFGLAGLQSPAFWFKPDIYQLCQNAEKPPVKIVMTTGLINDTEEGTKKMVEILERNTCHYEYKSVAQGNSWGNWRDLIDDILVSFFPYGTN
jgi:enterochelin esterase-like enzyme